MLEDSKNKLISYKDYTNKNYSNLLFLEGHFESEKYFQEYSKDIKNQFIISQHIASILFNYIPKRKSIAINNIKIAFPEKSDKMQAKCPFLATYEISNCFYSSVKPKQ